MSKPSPFPYGYGFSRRLRLLQQRVSLRNQGVVAGQWKGRQPRKGVSTQPPSGHLDWCFCANIATRADAAPELLSEGGGNWGVHIPPLLRHCVALLLRSTNPSVFLSFIWAGWTSSGTRQKRGHRNTRHVCHSDKSIGMQGRLWWYLLCFVSCVT